MQSRHCGLGSGIRRVKAQAHGHLCLPLAKPEQDANEPAALSPYFPSPLPYAVWKGSW